MSAEKVITEGKPKMQRLFELVENNTTSKLVDFREKVALNVSFKIQQNCHNRKHRTTSLEMVVGLTL